MEKLNLDHWFVENNELSISLMNLHTKIKITNLGNNVFFSLTITDSDKKELIILCRTLEEAISFVEDIVSKSYSLDEVSESYNNRLQRRIRR